MDQNESKMQIAVLIDSENVSSRYASIIFNEIETYGFATYRRIYGNWTKNNGWSENILLENSITPIQQFNYTSGKNSSDMTMVIDAMETVSVSSPATAILPGSPCACGKPICT